MSQTSRRFSLLALVLLTVGGILGGLLGGGAQAEQQKPEDELWSFGRILSLVEDQYVGETDSKQMVEDAIDGMLQTLDPHSSYLNPEAFGEMRDEQRGKFSGLGIQITKRGPDNPLTIIAPIDGTPAYRAGLQSGDVISKIEGQATMELTVHEAVRLLKGDKGTEVTITIDRPGSAEDFDVTIERDDIPIESIRVAHMLDGDVGFVRISNFTSTTAEELDAAIERLKQEGMTRLMIDLRGNPGGLLEQAVQVSERFIPAGELVVFTRGRIPGSDQDYVAKRGVERVDLPLILLVNHSSASASEIVSGAIQDHDRGLVVGETTFGKGLVQRVIPLRNEGALAVTTAKYYTPSGRLIQRDYSDLEEYYLSRADEVEPGEQESQDPTGSAASTGEDPGEVRYTASGRKVYGGGGIRPDYIVESPKAPAVLIGMFRENLIFDFAVRYVNSHPALTRDFEVDEAILADFRAFLEQREYEFEAEKFKEHRDVITLRLKAQIARVKWDQAEESRVLTSGDPQVQRALELFGEAAELARRGARGRPGDKPPAALRAEANQDDEDE
jgi:carboxyl-terminal processing protease